MTKRVVMGALALAAIAAPSARAARWSGPYRLPFGSAYVASFAVADDGRAAILGANADESGGGEAPARIVVAVPGRGLVARGVSTPGLELPRVAIAGHDRLALAWTTAGAAPQVLAAGGTLAAPDRDGRPLSATCDGCAVDRDLAQVQRADGTALVGWIDRAGYVRYSVLVPGDDVPLHTGVLGGPAADAHALALGLDAQGRVIATWISGGALISRVGTMSGDFAAATRQVVGGGLETTNQGPVVVETDASGDQYAFWRVGEPGQTVTLNSAYRPAGGAFGAARVLARVRETRSYTLQWDAHAGAGGQAGIAYALVPNRRGMHDAVKVRLARGAGRWGAPRSLGWRGSHRRYAAAPKIGLDGRAGRS